MAHTNRKIVFFPPKNQFTETETDSQFTSQTPSHIKYFGRPPISEYVRTP